MPASAALLGKQVNFFSIVSTCLWLCLLLLWVGFLLNFDDPALTTLAVFLITLLGLIVQRLMPIARLNSNPLLSLLIVRLILAYIVPYTTFVMWPDQEEWFHGNIFPSHYFNSGMIYIFVCSIAAIAGILLGPKLLPRRRENGVIAPLVSPISPSRLTMLLYVVGMLDIVMYYVIGLGRYVEYDSRNYIAKALCAIIWPFDTVLMVYLVAVGSFPMRRRATLWIILALLFSYSVITITGSKGGVFLVCLYWACFKFVSERPFELPLRRMLKLALPVVLLTIVGLYLGYYIKWVTRTFSVEQGQSQITAADISTLVQDKDVVDPSEFFLIPVRRNSLIEQALTVVNEEVRNPYLTWEKTLKAIFDRLAPGDSFNDWLPTERIYGIVYRGFSEKAQNEFIRQNDQWSIFALMFAYSRYFGILWVFGMCLFFSLGYSFIGNIQGWHAIFLKMWWITTFDMTFMGFGLDFTAANAVPMLLQGLIFLIIIRRSSYTRAQLEDRLRTAIAMSGQSVPVP